MNITQKMMLIALSLSFVPVQAKKLAECPQLSKINKKLVSAARSGDLAGVKEAVKKGADVNCVNERYYEFTPLMYAAKYGRMDVVRYLLGKGADASATNAFGNDAYKVAMNHDQKATAELLENK